MDDVRLSRQTYNLAERLISGIEKIANELERLNDNMEERNA